MNGGIRFLGALTGVALVLTVISTGRADTTQACDAAYRQTQVSRRAGKLLDARKQALICGAPACPDADKTDCKQWLAEIETSVPTVVFAAQDALGVDTLKVRVSVDGQVMGEALDGKAVELDPGPHKLRFETAGADPIEQDVLIRQGEKDRRIAVSFMKREAAPPPPPPVAAPAPSSALVSPPPPVSSRGVPGWAWATGALGLAFAGAAVGIGVDGLNAVSSLKKGCASTDPAVCTPMPAGSYTPDADNARKDRDFALAIGFGAVGVAGIGTAVARIVKGSGKPPASGLRLRPIVGTNVRGAVISGSW